MNRSEAANRPAVVMGVDGSAAKGSARSVAGVDLGAAIHRLEAGLRATGQDPRLLWAQPQDWSSFGTVLDDWITTSAQEMARGALVVAAVIDIESVLVDGAFPASVRARLVTEMRRAMLRLDTRGIVVPRVEAGDIGGNARALGAASVPIVSQYLLNTHGILAAL